MIKIGLIKEGKIPTDCRVALTPSQCKWLHKNFADIRIIVQSCPSRCYSDQEYVQAGIPIAEEVTDCDILMGIKEVPIDSLLENKIYLFFSHTKIRMY